MDFRDKCRLVEKCLPDSPYREQMTALHDAMLDEIECAKHTIYGAQADQITRPLRELLERTLPMISGAGCGTLAAEICKAIGVPNVKQAPCVINKSAPQK